MALSATSNYAVAGPLVLSADVANGGTVTIAYPTGTAQADYTGGNAGNAADNMVVFNNGDKYTGAQVGLTFGASNITLTNNSGGTWSSAPASGVTGTRSVTYFVGLPRIDPVLRYNGPKAIV